MNATAVRVFGSRDALIDLIDENDVARFWKMVRKTRGCWIFGACQESSHPSFAAKGKSMGAHRFAKRITDGFPTEKGKNLACHRCNRKVCVRPSHIYWGSYSDNINDRNKSFADFYKRQSCEKSPVATITRRQVHQIWSMYYEKDTRVYVICKTLGINRGLVEAIIGRRAWIRLTSKKKHQRKKMGYAFGEDAGLAKLTDAKVQTIRQNVTSGQSGASQARLFGVSNTTITHIMQRKTWRHI